MFWIKKNKKGNVMKKVSMIYVISLVILLGISNLLAFGPDNVHKEFKGKSIVKIKTVSGDCIVKKGSSDKIIVDLKSSVNPEDSFEPEFRESGKTLKIIEHWHGSSSGNVTWTITVPQNTEIDFSTASGDLSVYGLNSKIEANTASGEITIENSEGEFKISTASGDVNVEEIKGEIDFSTASGDIDASNINGEIEICTASGEIDIDNASGFFELSCASGDIDIKNITIEEESSFSTASGNVEVELAKSAQYDLNLSAASGDVTLNYNGNPVKGYFELTARKNRGKIRSALKFDKETEFERYDQTYMKKVFTKGNDTPKIILETSSGKVTLKK